MFAGGLVSSGEECAKFVGENFCCNSSKDGGGSGKAMKALWFTWQESESQNPVQFLSYCESGVGAGDNLISGKGKIDIAKSVEEADFILLHGSEVWRRCRELPTPDDDDSVQDLNFLYNEDFTFIDPILESASRRNLPMVCANPDFIVGLPGGVVGNMPGKIAQRYVSKGGSVQHFGKPHSLHFHACLDNLGIVFDANAKSIPGVAHVGDSLEHDVAGANAAGIDSVFVLGGIHAKELGLIPTGSEDGGIAIMDDDGVGRQETACIPKKELTMRLQSFFEEKGIWPTHVVPSLTMSPAVFTK